MKSCIETSYDLKPTEPSTGVIGPNGGKIGFLPNGDKVEWVKDEDEEGKPIEMPVLLRRNESDIRKAYKEFRDKAWWNHHQQWLIRITTVEETLTEEQNLVMEKAQNAASKIEQEYGKENLRCDGFELGLLNGKMAALAWVMGSEWDESLDT